MARKRPSPPTSPSYYELLGQRKRGAATAAGVFDGAVHDELG